MREGLKTHDNGKIQNLRGFDSLSLRGRCFLGLRFGNRGSSVRNFPNKTNAITAQPHTQLWLMIPRSVVMEASFLIQFFPVEAVRRSPRTRPRIPFIQILTPGIVQEELICLPGGSYQMKGIFSLCFRLY